LNSDNKDVEQYVEYVYQGDGECIEVPCMINNIKIMGLVDTGANVSLIDKSFVEENNWAVTPRTGSFNQAIEGQAQNRIGQVENVVVRAGKESATIDLDVINLSGNTRFIIGMNLFNKLGFKLSNIPFTWPVSEPIIDHKVKSVSENEHIENVDSNGIANEWKRVIEDNINLPSSSVCKLENSELSINTGDNKPSWIRQYPIPQALIEKVKERIQLWKDNKWIVDAPNSCQ
jgi:predicted aspartyl protease